MIVGLVGRVRVTAPEYEYEYRCAENEYEYKYRCAEYEYEYEFHCAEYEYEYEYERLEVIPLVVLIEVMILQADVQLQVHVGVFLDQFGGPSGDDGQSYDS